MITSFRDNATEDVFSGEAVLAFPLEIYARARRKLFAIDAAESISDLRIPPGNRLHVLQGNRAGQYSISINDQWRICFRFENGQASDVEICDYH